MFSKTIFIAAFTAFASIASAAAPPGCLIGAVNNYNKPGDISAVCKDKSATSYISKTCGDNTKAALEAFADICNNAGVKVSTDISSATGSAKPSGTGFSTGYHNGTATSGAAQATGTGSGGNGGSPTSPATTTATGTGAPISTGAAGQLEIGVAALFAGLGLAAVAL